MAELQIPEKTKFDQNRAADPDNSAWVSANAGSGKTFVLARRVIRLMLEGTAPSRILCLTFTKAAAAEMSNRVFGDLARWTMLEGDKLAAEIKTATGKSPSENLIRRARQLFALALDTPGGLKIQTIHAFCEALLHQFPLEANISGHFQVLDDAIQRSTIEEARRDVLLQSQVSNRNLAKAYDAAMGFGSDKAISDALDYLVSNRGKFLDWVDGDVDEAMGPVYSEFSLEPDAGLEAVREEGLANTLISKDQWMEFAKAAFEDGKTKNLASAQLVKLFVEEKEINRQYELRCQLLLTKKLVGKADVFFGEVKKLWPELPELIEREQQLAEAAVDRVKTWRILNGSRALFRIALAVLERYQRLKLARGFADYDDLITQTASLLNRSDIRQWVQYKLDRGIDHLLVDEAQDTSPRQWEIIDAIVEDFHAGETASHRKRTIFAVGDEKQSIYSFQGAEPELFDRQHREFRKRALQSGNRFESVKLELSFRSTKAILSAVDAVFSIPENAQGLSQVETSTVHESIRGNARGQVQVWPIFEQAISEPSDEWLDNKGKNEVEDPAALLAARMTREIKSWIGQKLEGTGKPIRYGDILVLIRKRDRFANILTRTMKENGLAVAGSDRLILTDHIAVEDLMALGRFVLMHEDDLSLAAVLKSPLFDISEDTLFELASNREGGSLYSRIRHLCDEPANDNLRLTAQTICSNFSQWSELSRSVPVFEFYARILGAHGSRRNFIARLGSEVEEVLDVFLDACLDYDQTGRRGLEDFIAKFSGAAPEVKRQIDLDRDEIRILTVHSSKGLEAPIVFLVDPCGPAFSHTHRPDVLTLPLAKGGNAWLWQPAKLDGTNKTDQSLALVKQRAEEEYRRLLYVGMTRAADRLIVCGYKGTRATSETHWHKMVEAALQEQSEPLPDIGGQPAGFRWTGPTVSGAIAPPEEVVNEISPGSAELPKWVREKPGFEPPPPRPLTPSGAFLTLDTGQSENQQR